MAAAEPAATVAAATVAPLNASQRRPLLLAGLAAILALVARPGLLGAPAPFDWPASTWLLMLAGLALAIAAALGLAAIVRRPAADRPPGFCAAYATSVLFPWPALAFSSPYAALGGMTVAHGLQYLVLIGLAAGTRPAAEAGAAKHGSLIRIGLLANIALIGGAALSAASHLHDGGPAARLVFGAYLGIVMAHFVIDAGLWRLRDPLAAAFVTGRLPLLTATATPATTTPAIVAPR